MRVTNFSDEDRVDGKGLFDKEAEDMKKMESTVLPGIIPEQIADSKKERSKEYALNLNKAVALDKPKQVSEILEVTLAYGYDPQVSVATRGAISQGKLEASKVLMKDPRAFNEDFTIDKAMQDAKSVQNGKNDADSIKIMARKALILRELEAMQVAKPTPTPQVQSAPLFTPAPAPVPAPEKLDGIAESKETKETARQTSLGNFVSDEKPPFSTKEKGAVMVTKEGHTVIETPNSLVAPKMGLLKDFNGEKEKARAETMIEAAAQKFPSKPLRIDGSEKFVTACIDAALARGLAVEVHKGYEKLLAQREALHLHTQKEAALANTGKTAEVGGGGRITEGQRPMVNSGSELTAEQPEGQITASTARQRVTGKLVGYGEQNEDGKRVADIMRAGRMVQVETDVPVADLEANKGKGVRLEPATKGGRDTLVNLDHEKAVGKEKSAGLEIQK
jgi:hypothetical protein